ncbi:hypothetical protein HY745_09490 [Candidatus Desantisbacteria bacterium]|nr:hypothetical protein [Candidatus Desantisbacteria bacterium]
MAVNISAIRLGFIELEKSIDLIGKSKLRKGINPAGTRKYQIVGRGYTDGAKSSEKTILSIIIFSCFLKYLRQIK